MAGVLNIDADSVVGKLLRVWAWFDSHTEDGNAVGVTYPLLDRIAGVNGFAEAMAISGWLEQNGHTMHLPNFDRHNGKTAKNRALTNERVAKSRTKQQESNADSNGESVTKTVTREEKRREEERDMVKTAPAVVDSCPQQQIIDLYHQTLPTGRQIREWTPARATALRNRWRESQKRQSLDWWQRFFSYCSTSPFLTGQVTTPGRKPFELSLDWLIKPENMAKVIEGAYHETEREAA